MDEDDVAMTWQAKWNTDEAMADGELRVKRQLDDAAGRG
jgi:hypothetical protein